MWKILLILGVVIYSLSPYDLLPDFVVGWGWLDDLLIIAFAWQAYNRLKKKIGPFQDARTSGYQGNQQQEQNDFRNPPPRRDPFTVLGVNQNATAEDIKHAYRLLSGKYHPDKVSHLGEEFRQLAEERFKEIQEAYQYLSSQ